MGHFYVYPIPMPYKMGCYLRIVRVAGLSWSGDALLMAPAAAIEPSLLPSLWLVIQDC